ncbi:MAG: DUF4157 domain-containing protein [Acidobacteriota bacterium]
MPEYERESATIGSEATSELVQPKHTSDSRGAHVTGSVASRLNASSSGEPLSPTVRNFFESRFGMSLAAVHIHTGDEPKRLNTDLSAHAFTHGNDIFFGAGQYQPDTHFGRRLIAHELTHVLQQSKHDTWSIQRQALPEYGGQPPASVGTQASGGQSDAVVQALIDDALARYPTVETAFRDLQRRRCMFENCGDENLAAAEHYMFARHFVQDGLLPPEMRALLMSGAIGIYAILKFIGVIPSLCPDICPVTPTSWFQVSWEMEGVGDGLIVGSLPIMPPPGFVPNGGSSPQP